MNQFKWKGESPGYVSTLNCEVMNSNPDTFAIKYQKNKKTPWMAH